MLSGLQADKEQMILCVGVSPFFMVHGEKSHSLFPVTGIVDIFIDHLDGSPLHLLASWYLPVTAE